ncbi:MAG: MraZ protein, partial [Glaciecola sp.]
ETPDSQGRVTIPERLRVYAGLDRDLTVTGADETVQIWDRTGWDTYRDEAEDLFAGFDGVLGAPAAAGGE